MLTWLTKPYPFAALDSFKFKCIRQIRMWAMASVEINPHILFQNHTYTIAALAYQVHRAHLFISPLFVPSPVLGQSTRKCRIECITHLLGIIHSHASVISHKTWQLCQWRWILSAARRIVDSLIRTNLSDIHPGAQFPFKFIHHVRLQLICHRKRCRLWRQRLPSHVCVPLAIRLLNTTNKSTWHSVRCQMQANKSKCTEAI